MNRLADKVAIVTGSARGIGAACAEKYAAEGAKVVIADIDEEQAHKVGTAIADAGGEAFAIGVDVASADAVKAMVDATVQRYGRVDVLHNNAAMQNAEQMARDSDVVNLDMDVFDLTMAVNLRGYVLGAKYAIPHMIEAGCGSIVNTSSRAGTDGELRLTSYGLSKAAINALTQYIATQYGNQGIRCNALVIAGVLTERLMANTDEAYRARNARHMLVQSLATTEQVANCALFLACDESSYVTGHLLAVDGGWGAHSPRYADMLDSLKQA